jgi:hypothetical protein
MAHNKSHTYLPMALTILHGSHDTKSAGEPFDSKNYTCPQDFVTLVPVGSVAKVVEGDDQVLRAAQGCPFTVGRRVGDQQWGDEPAGKRT